MNGIDQRGHRIIQRPLIFCGLTGCQPDPRVGALHIRKLKAYLSSQTMPYICGNLSKDAQTSYRNDTLYCFVPSHEPLYLEEAHCS